MKPRLFKTRAGFLAWSLDPSNRGRAYDVRVLHDDECAPSRCACKPWFEVRDLTTENALESARAQDEWRRLTSS